MTKIFSHDIARVLRLSFDLCLVGLNRDDVLETLIKTSASFFDLLEIYSKGKQVLTLKTNRVLKGKKKKP